MSLVLILAFIVVPLLELFVLLQVADVIGLPLTLLVLLAVSVAGAALVRREGTRAWRRFQEALHAGRMPTQEVVDGALLLLAGALLLTPGFVTDTVGLLLLAPPTRALVSRALRGRVRLLRGTTGRRRAAPRRQADSDDALEAEVVHVERTAQKRPPTLGGR